MGAAVAQGATQLLVVGAGFDPLASLVARRHPQVLCVEIDAPPTADPKRQGVEGAGLARANHRICSADLSTTALGTVLEGTGWRTDARSVVVAEGLLMYLRPTAVEAFFASVRGSTGPGSRLAFSTLDADEQGRPRVGTMDKPIRWMLKLAGEPMHWGLPPAAVSAFLRGAGYRLLEQPSIQGLRGSLLAPLGLGEEPLAPYEYLVLAEVTAG